MLRIGWRRVGSVLGSVRVYLAAQYPRRYPKLGPRLALTLGLVCAAPSCKNVNLFTLTDDSQLGEQTFPQVLQGEKLIESGPAYQMVSGVMNRLVKAARVEEPELVDAFEWEVKLIDKDETVNAFALPGGKMAVYTGILPVAETEAGLAVVMGHEIGHVLERHGTEAMTRQYGAEVLLGMLFKGDAAALAQLGNSLVQLRFGRGAELEADARGLRLMARAGYDPRVAVQFWTRMTQLGSSGTPEFLSTHPSHEKRIEQIKGLLPEVIPIYEANKAN